MRESKRYKDHADFTIQGVADRFKADFGDKPLDIVVHSLANGPEVKRALIHTSRKGYLSAMGSSSYSFVSMVRRFGPLLRPNGVVLEPQLLRERARRAGLRRRHVVGQGRARVATRARSPMKRAALYGARVNSISAGAWASRAASAIGFIQNMIDYTSRNSPLPEAIVPADVGATAAFLCSPLASGITASVVRVDKGFSAMGVAVDAVPDNLSEN